MAYEVTTSLPKGIERDQVFYIEDMCVHKGWEFASYRHTRTTTDETDKVRVYMYVWDDFGSDSSPIDNGYVVSLFKAGTDESLDGDDYDSDETCIHYDIFRDVLPDALSGFISEVIAHDERGDIYQHLTEKGLTIDDIADAAIREMSLYAKAQYEQMNNVEDEEDEAQLGESEKSQPDS